MVAEPEVGFLGNEDGRGNPAGVWGVDGHATIQSVERFVSANGILSIVSYFP